VAQLGTATRRYKINSSQSSKHADHKPKTPFIQPIQMHTPSQSLPANTPQRHSVSSPWGSLTLAATPMGLCGVWFDGQRHQPDVSAWPWAASGSAQHTLLAATAEALTAYFAGQQTRFDVPLDLTAGTAFQQAVWQALLAVPLGSTCSYRAISVAVGKPAAVRAVGAAVGRNPFSVIVPCHRVLGSNGALTGYAGGLERKAALLQLERSHSAAQVAL
jgi:methylated-DNA-[protein]-cysteine S-methyltransferase